jgi:hypothetical protein
VTKLVNPIPTFGDGRGGLLDAGYIWIGQAGTDPEVGANQLAIYWDKELTVPASQPLRTLSGNIVQGLNLGLVYFAETNFSLAIRDADGNLVTYIADAFDLGGTAYQPLDSDLSAIAGLSTTIPGRALLTIADAAALRAAAALGSSAVLDEATAADFRDNTPNKVLTTDQVWGAATTVNLVQSGGAVAVDFSSGINFGLTMTGGPWTLSSPTNVKDGQSGRILIVQDATGSRVLNYGTGWIFAGGTDPILSTAPNTADVLFYQVLGANVLGSLVKAVS